MTSLGECCSDVSRAVAEPLSATATWAERWVLVEVRGAWPRDVGIAGPLPEPVHEGLAGWLARTPRSRLLFLRRPGRTSGAPAVFVVRADESAAETRRIDVEALDELAEVDLDSDGEPHGAPLVLVCGHGSRDRCCALRGTPVFGALSAQLGEEELWLSSHHGGHRFAGNVLVLPRGLHLGRVDPPDAADVVARALHDRIDLAHYRGRTFYEPRDQAAEHAVREALGLDRVDDLRLAGAEDGVVRFRTADGAEHAAAVEGIDGPPVPVSCGAEPEAQAHWRARLA